MSKKITMRQKVMDFIKAAGPDGLRFTDIQRFIVEELKGLDYDEMEGGYKYISDDPTYSRWIPAKRIHRGWWIGPLCRKGGVLDSCRKVGKRYVHKEFDWYEEDLIAELQKHEGQCQRCPGRGRYLTPETPVAPSTPRTQVSRIRIDRETGEAQANFGGEYVHVEVAARLETDLKLKSSECEALRREIIELKKYRTCCERIMGNIATLENDIGKNVLVNFSV